jgi:hypothetical protein
MTPARPFRFDTNPSEDELIANWIGDTGGRRFRWAKQEWAPEHKSNHATGRAKAQARKQADYARECEPQEDRDEELIRLYGAGLPVAKVSERTGVPYDQARKRILACHPEGKSLR